MLYRYQTISNQEIPKYKKELDEFFLKLGYNKNYHIAIINSAFICICLFDDAIVGAGRIVSDLCRFAFIVDLNVKASHQRKGIGKQLLENIVKECRNRNINQIEISTDPNFSWLENFYTKIGFKKITDSVAMEYHLKKSPQK